MSLAKACVLDPRVRMNPRKLILIFSKDIKRESCFILGWSLKFVQGDLVNNDCGVEEVGKQNGRTARNKFKVADHKLDVLSSCPH